MPRKHGLFSELQFKVLQLRVKEGLSQAEIAKMLGTTRENITIIEKRAKRNLRLAKETIQAYKLLFCITKVNIEAGTRLVDVPGIVIRAGDSVGVKLNVNFTRVYDEIRFKAGDCVSGSKVVKPFTIAIFRDGNIEVTRGL
jgi:Tfx family DNA-binding protein